MATAQVALPPPPPLIPGQTRTIGFRERKGIYLRRFFSRSCARVFEHGVVRAAEGPLTTNVTVSGPRRAPGPNKSSSRPAMLHDTRHTRSERPAGPCTSYIHFNPSPAAGMIYTVRQNAVVFSTHTLNGNGSSTAIAKIQ